MGRPFLAGRGRLLVWWVIFGFAHALDVDLFRLSEFTAVLALSNGTTLLFYLKKRAICMFAGGGTVTFDTSFTGIFFVANENHCV